MSPSRPDRHFEPALFRFLADLKANNDRDWFDEQKPRYEAEVRQPALRFIVDFGPHLVKVSPHFRADLARLLCVVELRVPTLRERRDDLALLARSLLGVAGPGLSAEAVNRLRRHDWPENIPELGRVLEEARARSASGLIRAEHLTFPKSAAPPRPMIPGARLSDIERYAILETLAANGGSTSRAARVLGISVRKIQYKLHEYGAARAELKRTALG